MLARAIAGEITDVEIYQLARRIAEAQIELQRVRYARHQLLFQTMSDPKDHSKANVLEKMKLVVRCLRTAGPRTPMPDDILGFVYPWPEGPNKFATNSNGTKSMSFLFQTGTNGERYPGANLPFEPSRRNGNVATEAPGSLREMNSFRPSSTLFRERGYRKTTRQTCP